MAEEAETAPVVDEAPVAETAAPGEAEAPASPPEGYIEQSRYDNLRAEHNRKQSLWDRAQQGDLDAMRELQLPVQFEDESEEDEEDGPRDPRLDALLAEREQEKHQREATENWNRFTSDLDKLAKDKDTSLSDRERFMVYTETLQAGGTPDALATVFGDYLKEREAAEKAAVQRYIDSKKNAPFVSPGGTGANQVTDPLDGKARRERLAARLDANGF